MRSSGDTAPTAAVAATSSEPLAACCQLPPPRGLQAYSLESLVETLELAFISDSPSSTSTISSSSTQQEMDLILGSQVTVTLPDMEDQGHQVPDLTENLEPMQEEAEDTGPPSVLVETPAQVLTPPPPGRELELETPAMADPGQQPLLDPQPDPLTETNPERPFLAPSFPLFLLFILCFYFLCILCFF